MTARTAAIGFFVLLTVGFLVTLFGRYADCYVSMFFGSITGFLPHSLLRERCWDQTFGFIHFFFSK
jgi:hypothetical protein